VRGMEILFEARDHRGLQPGLAERATRSGTRYRLELPEADLYAVLEQLRASNARILSITQVRPTLEDYFLRMVDREQPQSHAVGVTP
jgi:hypothetical protein